METKSLVSFVADMTARFRAGLETTLDMQADTFSFEFPLASLPAGKPDEPARQLTMICLIRPKELADHMLGAMQAIREQLADAGNTN